MGGLENGFKTGCALIPEKIYFFNCFLRYFHEQSTVIIIVYLRPDLLELLEPLLLCLQLLLPPRLDLWIRTS
jgi:hypothetical protein